MESRVCSDCQEEFAAETSMPWKLRCLRCFKQHRDQKRPSSRSRSPQPRDRGGIIFKIGMMKGRTFRDVQLTDPSYVEWALGLPVATGQILQFVHWLRGEPSPFKQHRTPDEAAMTADVYAVHCQLLAAKAEGVENSVRKATLRELQFKYHPDRNESTAGMQISQYLSQAKGWFLSDD